MKFIADIFLALSLLNRRRDLSRLMKWAQKKQLSKQMQYYFLLLVETEVKLMRRSQLRRAYLFAQIIHMLNTRLFSVTRFHRRGAADDYSRRRRLTYKSNNL